ncbi:MAG: metalloprotease PmbA [Pseudomonadota bacterium]
MGELAISNQSETIASESVQRALEVAVGAGADAAEAAASFETGLSVTARQREVESLEFQNDRGFSITVYKDQRKGSASTSDLSPDAIAAAVSKAMYIASQTEADEYAGLADPSRMASSFPDLELDHAWGITADAASEMAVQIEAAALGVDDRIKNSEGASVATQRGLSVYGNTHGFLGTQRRSAHSRSCAVVAQDAQGMERDYHYTAARNPSRLVDGVEVGREAGRRAVNRLSPVKIETRDAPILFRADRAGGLIGHLLGAIAGGAQYRKASYLLGAVGQQVMASSITIAERPHLLEGMGSTAFDGEGVATADRDIVRDGVLQGYVLSSYSARRLGLESTANAGGVHNATVSGGGGDFEAMLQKLDTGLLVTELMGQGVNIVTGDYSRGAAGYWVEGGEIRYPVSEVTIAGNLSDMFQQIATVGDDRDERGRVHCGSVLIESMKIAGN